MDDSRAGTKKKLLVEGSTDLYFIAELWKKQSCTICDSLEWTAQLPTRPLITLNAADDGEDKQSEKHGMESYLNYQNAHDT
jgi:hypothetical protein